MIRAFPRFLRFAQSFKTLHLSQFSTQMDTTNTKKKVYPEFSINEHSLGQHREPRYRQIPDAEPYDDELTPLRLPEIKTRILFVLNKYEQVALNDKFDWKGEFDKDFGLDSLDKIAIITSIEEEFHTVFEDNAFDNFISFSDVADFIATLPQAY